MSGTCARKEKRVRLPQGDFPVTGQSQDGHHYVGHTHFWERALLSRRQFMTTAAGTTGVVLASGLWMPGRALADNPAPKPIPGDFQFFGPGTTVFHIDAMSPGPTENSTIFDFDGAIGAAIVDGTGTATNTKTGVTQSLNFDTDMRFMQGVYIGLDGEKHRGTFSLI